MASDMPDTPDDWFNQIRKDGNVPPKEIFETKELIGLGSGSKVVSVKKGQFHFALKIIHLHNRPLERYQKNLSKILDIKHPNLVHHYGWLWNEEKFYIVMEFCFTSLATVLHIFDEPFKEDEVAFSIRQVLLGLEYLHANNLAHCQLQPSQILLTKKGEVKLSDYGSQRIRPTRGGPIFPPYWESPEQLKLQERDEKLSDVWSLGITAIELAQGAPPLADVHPMRALFLIGRGPPPTLEDSKLSFDFQDFVSHCLQQEQQDRWRVEKLLCHPFVTYPEDEESLSPLIPYLLDFESKKKLFEEEWESE